MWFVLFFSLKKSTFDFFVLAYAHQVTEDEAYEGKK